MQRTRCSFAAKFSFGDVYLCDGIIKNITATGARLLIRQNTWLPGEFTITSEILDRPRQVQTVWSNKEHIGVKFIYNQN